MTDRFDFNSVWTDPDHQLTLDEYKAVCRAFYHLGQLQTLLKLVQEVPELSPYLEPLIVNLEQATREYVPPPA